MFSSPGKKQDTWVIVDPKSGEKQTTLSTEAWDGQCPSSPLLYIGRTRKPALLPVCFHPSGAGSGVLEVTSCPARVPEYVITMYDTKSRELRWNATFSEYSAPLCEERYHYSEWPWPRQGLGGELGQSSLAAPRHRLLLCPAQRWLTSLPAGMGWW